jgi:hypothetical protein
MVSIYTTRPNRIYNIACKHVEDILRNDPNPGRQCAIPHFFYEFNNDPDVVVIDACPSPGPNGVSFLNIPIGVLSSYLISVTKPSTKLCFDNLYEGNLLPMINVIAAAIQNTPIRNDQIYYFSGALDCSTYTDIPFHLYGGTMWEAATRSREIPPTTFSVSPKQKIFLCMNRVLRPHRLMLVSLLLAKNMVSNSFYSFFPLGSHSGNATSHQVDGTLSELSRLLSPDTFAMVNSSYRKHESMFPLTLNIESSNNKNFLDANDIYLFQNSYFSLVTETFFFRREMYNTIDEQTIFFTEKIFKPILMHHPFMVVSRPGTLHYLRKIGYKTFSPYVDESYDLVEDDQARMMAVVKEVERLSAFTTEQWLEWQQNVKATVDYNYDTIMNKAHHKYAFSR